MSSRVTTRALKNTISIVGLLCGAVILTGCSSFGSPSPNARYSNQLVTGSIGQSGQGVVNQAMPGALPGVVSGAPRGPYVPSANVGVPVQSAPVQTVSVQALPAQGAQVQNMPNALPQQNRAPLTTASVSTVQLLPSSQNNSALAPVQTLPAQLQTSSIGSSQTMPAQVQVAPVASVSNTPIPQPNVARSAPALTVVEQDMYKHNVESGESLYVIARRYGVTTDAIVRANGLSSADQIFVGQQIAIPGRADLMAARVSTNGAADPVTTASVQTPQVQASQVQTEQGQPTNSTPTQTPSATSTPRAVASATVAPATSADNFRWPVNGRVITDFQNSRQTGINIEAPDGATVRAAENGTVIYVGSGVEGYGNLILVRHSNGFVSAYAHLKDITVAKDSSVNRGDQIGTVGMSGSVNRPQLHFELRKGAKPVDPMPLLAS